MHRHFEQSPGLTFSFDFSVQNEMSVTRLRENITTKFGVFLRPSVLELCAWTGHTDRWTDGANPYYSLTERAA